MGYTIVGVIFIIVIIPIGVVVYKELFKYLKK